MNSLPIFVPFLGAILLTFVVWICLIVRRVGFILSTRPPPHLQSSTGLATVASAAVMTPSDNLKNLCELPLVFYALVLYLHARQQVDSVHVASAWVFLAGRVAHSLVHCTFNHTTVRFAAYIVASAALWFMLLRASLAILE